MKFKTCREQKEKANMESYPDSKQTLGSSFHCWVMVALVKGFVANLGDPLQGFSEDLQCSRPTSAPSEHGWLAEWVMFGMTKPPKIHLICAVKFQPAGLLKGFEGSDFCDLPWVQLEKHEWQREAFGTLLCHLFLCDSTVETARFFGSESSWIRESYFVDANSWLLGQVLEFWGMSHDSHLVPQFGAIKSCLKPGTLGPQLYKWLVFSGVTIMWIQLTIGAPQVAPIEKTTGGLPQQSQSGQWSNGGEPVFFFLGWYLGTRFLVCRSYSVDLDHISFTQMASHNGFL